MSVITLGAAYLQLAVSTRQAALFIVGAAAGIVLYHAAFGFTTAWRVFIADRRGAGIRAQMLLFAVTALVFFPAIGMGTFFNQAVRGSVAPLSLGLLHRGVHVRHRHAARRRLRLGDAVYGQVAAAFEWS